MVIDTHAHLAELKSIFDEKTFEVIATELRLDDLVAVISIGCTLEEIEASKSIAKQYENIFYTAGLYPHKNAIENRGLCDEELVGELEAHLAKNDKKLVAIGECGLDFSQDAPENLRSQTEQADLFERQIILASKYKLPIVIHSRKATQETLGLLQRLKTKYTFNAIWHCFNEGRHEAQQILDLGIKFSINGIITYKSGDTLREAIGYIPIEEIMLETDCPFLTPEPERSKGIKTNMPKYVKITAEMLAKIKKVDFTEVSNVTSQNAIKFFSLKNIDYFSQTHD